MPLRTTPTTSIRSTSSSSVIAGRSRWPTSRNSTLFRWRARRGLIRAAPGDNRPVTIVQPTLDLWDEPAPDHRQRILAQSTDRVAWLRARKIGRASCREREEVSVVAGLL